MKRKKTTEYLITATITAVFGIVLTVVTAVALGGMSTPVKDLKGDGADIMQRTAEITGGNNVSLAEQRVGSGLMSVGDYTIRCFTSADYLSLNKDDEAFANDLAIALEGEADPDTVDDILDLLDDHSRMYAIDQMVTKCDKSFASTTEVSADPGDSFTDCVVTKPLEGTDGYTIGIRRVEGNFTATGDEVRTDFFVDGVLYQGNIRMSDAEDGDGNDFVMAWDTSVVDSGEPDVFILLRSSDGRGQIIAGGTIMVPRCMTLVNDRVQQGSIDQNSSISWYILNAEDRDAYVNFVGLSDDIKVSLYDAYGEFIGTNDLLDSDYEILRGHKQDVNKITEDTGIPGASNNFFVRVERGEGCSSESDAISYTMVQSRNVALYEGSYYAVLDDIGAVPTPLPISSSNSPYSGSNVRLGDLNNNEIEVVYEDVRYLPLSGFLTKLDLSDTGTGRGVDFFPNFAGKTVDYGFYSTSLGTLNLDFVTQEGYAATVDITLDNQGNVSSYSQGDTITLGPGENTIKVTVNAFDGTVKSYSVYILNGDDSGDFSESTLSLFPQSYYSGLWLLHSLHPAYCFRPYNTGMSFPTVLDNEDSADRSLANIYSHPAWCQSGSPEYDGGGWYAATNEVVQYFVDPRNYLDPQHIFSFEMLSFDSTAQTVDGVRNIVAGSFMEDTSEYDYAQIIYDAGQTANVSPYFLASRILQEMGYNGESELCHGTLDGYEGYYNFYNIGSTPDPSIQNGALINGARYAQWGQDPDGQQITPEEASLMLPWNSVDRAITGGALWIASRYTAAGQDTLYFQKFDVIDNEDGLYMHQYAQNISMAYTEGARYFSGYASIDMLDQPFTFVIPVYTDMPEQFGTMPYSGA